MDRSKVASEVASWISKNCQHAHGKDVNADSELIDSGLLDSLDYLNLVSFIEEAYGAEVDGDAMIPENFRTPMAIAGLVE